MAGKWCFPKLAPTLPLSRTLTVLHNDLMLQSQIWGRGSGRCIQWVTLSRLDVGANTGDAILRNLCMLSSLRFAGEKEVSSETELRPMEGVGGKRRAKTFPNICLF